MKDVPLDMSTKEYNLGQIAAAYDMARAVNAVQMRRVDAIRALVQGHNIDESNSAIFIDAMRALFDGRVYKMALGLEAVAYCVDRITESDGIDGRRRALAAYLANIEYYERNEERRTGRSRIRREHRALYRRLIEVGGRGSADLDGVVDVDSEVSETSGTRQNAPWSRDELILALDLYMRHRAAPPAKDAPEIQELSDVLNNLGAVLGQRTSGTYRNENGVYMKLMNFRRLDPQYTADGKKGLSRGNKDEAFVWSEFAGNPVRLAEVAQFIRANVTKHANDSDLAGPEEPSIEEAEEGRVATRVHRYRERDRRLVEKVKSQALKKHGRLFCVACNFDFSKQYGDAGAGIIDVHHTKPVHTMQPGEKTKVSDLVLLCSNCHRVVHSRRKWLTVEELRSALRE